MLSEVRQGRAREREGAAVQWCSGCSGAVVAWGGGDLAIAQDPAVAH